MPEPIRHIQRILIANRGEIALRIMRTIRKMGLISIAVYSDADKDAPHVKYADIAVHIGPSPVAESYLNTEAVLTAAENAGADAIHPGYGFLSENASFAKAVEAAGLVFIGPSAEAIAVMGDKAAAKRLMIEAGVPCVPGYQGEDQSDAVFMAEAETIGYPLMIKAAAGGGGRGMRRVDNNKELANGIALARSEAENAFGAGELILEKAIIRPRHVEIQIMADMHGAILYLGERDCSVQRRHQKVIEEAPCPVMTPDLRARMGEAAVDAARKIHYSGAGTVEFLLDESGTFYFLEMNTRLQVEHPVTELITGYDLVEMQIRIAQGEALPIQQEDISLNGHAIEVRLYAEDTTQDFLPSTGKISLWRAPRGKGVRVDAGIESGQEVSPFYDPMLAKIMAWGETREQARLRLVKALEQTALFGPQTNRDFLISALEKDAFIKGEATTAFIAETFSDEALRKGEINLNALYAAAILQYRQSHFKAKSRAISWAEPLTHWNSAYTSSTPYQYQWGEDRINLWVSGHSADHYEVRHGERFVQVRVKSDRVNTRAQKGGQAVLRIDDHVMRLIYHTPSEHQIALASERLSLALQNHNAIIQSQQNATSDGTILAPMHGKMLEIYVEPGQNIEPNTRLGVLEAMKMQHEILTEKGGRIAEIHAQAGVQISAGDIIMQIDIQD